MLRVNSHAHHILETLYYTGSKLTATDLSHVSNANQYFCKLEQLGLITSERGFKGKSKVKYRFISSDQRKKVENLLKDDSHESKNGKNRFTEFKG